MVRKANTNLITCESFGEAAEMAVRCSKIMKLADEGDLEAILKMKTICDCEPAKPASPNYPPCPPLPPGSTTSGKAGVGDGKGTSGGVSSQTANTAKTPMDFKLKKPEISGVKLPAQKTPVFEQKKDDKKAATGPTSPAKPAVKFTPPYKASTTDKKDSPTVISQSVAAKPPVKPPVTPVKPPVTPPKSSPAGTPLKPLRPMGSHTPHPSTIKKPPTPSASTPKPPTPSTSTVKPPSKTPVSSPSDKKSFSTVPSSNDKSQQDPKKADNKDPFANGDTVIIKT